MNFNNNSNQVDIVITDLDGTLLDSNNNVRKDNYETFNRLKERKICSVIATGRSFYSLKKVLPEDFPLDYLIFSSGSGIMDWKSKKIIFSSQLGSKKVVEIGNQLISMEMDFMVHYPIPENHKFSYYHTGRANPDFFRRIELYKEFAEPLSDCLDNFGPATQIVVISVNGEYILKKIKTSIKKIQAVRTTSPLDNKTNWFEIFNQGISKAHAAKWLCRKLGISHSRSIAIGNDYNDLNLLEWAEISYVVENAPQDLKKQFKVTKSNDRNGFSVAVNNVIKL